MKAKLKLNIKIVIFLLQNDRLNLIENKLIKYEYYLNDC